VAVKSPIYFPLEIGTLMLESLQDGIKGLVANAAADNEVFFKKLLLPIFFIYIEV